MTVDSTTTRCLNCSLGCALAVKQVSRDVIEPEYVEQKDGIAYGRLCYKGHYPSALMAHPRRLASPSVRSDRGGSKNGSTAIYRAAAEKLSTASASGRLGVLIDANLPTSEIAAVAKFFQSSMPAKHVAVFVPPTDAAIARGVAQSAEGNLFTRFV